MAEQAEIPKVKLGGQGLEVSRLGFGCMGLSGVYNDPLPEEEGLAVIIEAFKKGITFFDTSDIYGINHANEYLLGKALKQLPREKVQVATKFGIFKIDLGQVTVKGTPEYVRSCCEASLKRLDVDYIDLFYVHRIDATIPIEVTMSELKKLVEEGKIKYIGLSEASPDTIRRAHAVHPITALQTEYSLWTRDIEEEIIPLCRELGIGIVPYSPIGRGFFGGKAVKETLAPTSFLNMHPRLTGENLEKNKNLYFCVETLAQKYKCTPPQLALAWVLHQGDDVVPIPGTTKIKNLHDNCESIKVKLTKEDIVKISEAVPLNEVAGNSVNDFLLCTNWQFINTPPFKMNELKKLVEEGKIKYISLSEASPDTIRRAHAVHPITALQTEYSLWTRDIEEEIIPLCRELGIGIVPYSPIGRGFFGGKAVKETLAPTSFLNMHPRLTGENLEKNKNLYFCVETLAQKYKCTPPQLALAWVLHQGDDVVPIPGTTKIKNLHDNCESIKVKLTKEDIQKITEAVPLNEVAGNSVNDFLLCTNWQFINTPPFKV